MAIYALIDSNTHL